MQECGSAEEVSIRGFTICQTEMEQAQEAVARDRVMVEAEARVELVAVEQASVQVAEKGAAKI